MGNKAMVNQNTVVSALEQLLWNQGTANIVELVNELDEQGLSFGEEQDLLMAAKKQKVRYYISKARDKAGKRRFVSTQGILDFGAEYVFCKAKEADTEVKEGSKKSLVMVQKHLVGVIRATPFLPQWAVDEIVSAIEKVFAKLAA